MITYAILLPGDEMIGSFAKDGTPTPEECADSLAQLAGYPDRDSFLTANPRYRILGFAPIH